MFISPCNRILLRVDLRQNLTKSKMLMNQEQFKEKQSLVIIDRKSRSFFKQLIYVYLESAALGSTVHQFISIIIMYIYSFNDYTI